MRETSTLTYHASHITFQDGSQRIEETGVFGVHAERYSDMPGQPPAAERRDGEAMFHQAGGHGGIVADVDGDEVGFAGDRVETKPAQLEREQVAAGGRVGAAVRDVL